MLDDLNLGAPLPARACLRRTAARGGVVERARVGSGLAALRGRASRARVATGAVATGERIWRCAQAMGGRACGANQLGNSACRQPPADASGVAPPALAPPARCARMFEGGGSLACDLQAANLRPAYMRVTKALPRPQAPALPTPLRGSGRASL